MLKLYIANKNYSSWSLRPWLLMRELHIEFEEAQMPFGAVAFREFSPTGKVPCLVDACGIHPCHVGDLPDQCAALCRTNVNVQQLAVRAALNRDREAAYHALLLDPITAAALSLDKARDMFEELWQAEGDLLAYYD